MSFSNIQSLNPQRSFRQVTALTAPQTIRPDQRSHGTHNRQASITSNPNQALQDIPQVNNEIDYWPPDQALGLRVASPASVQHSTGLFSFEEDESHHESSFDDFLTTECSSDNHISEHTTPQELIWERQFVVKDTSQPDIPGNYGHAVYAASQELPEAAGTDLEGFCSNSQEIFPDLISGDGKSDPKLNISEIRTLHLSGETQIISPSKSQSMAGGSAPSTHKRQTPGNLNIATTPNLAPSPNHTIGAWNRPSPNVRAPSPVVMVSSYEATEAGEVAPLPVHSVNSKRNRDGENSEDEGNDSAFDGPECGSTNVDFSHLKPPGSLNTNIARANPAPRSGLEPSQRSGDIVLSIKDLHEQRQRDERNAEVQTWLETSEAGSEPDNESNLENNHRTAPGTRRRAHTTGQVDVLGRIYSDKNIPGPGVLVEVESDDEYSEEASLTSSQMVEHTEQIVHAYYSSESPQLSPHALDGVGSPGKTSFPTLDDGIPPELQEPLPRQFYRRNPWQDPVRGPVSDARDQPHTSNAAVSRFNQEAAKWETASRAATWGTRRRLSESEIWSIVEGSQVRHLSLSKRGRERGNSILSKARGLLPRRSSNNMRPQASQESHQPPSKGHAHRASLGTLNPAQRKPSFSNKPKSPPLDTGSALIAMTGQLAAIGRGNPMAQDVDSHKSPGALQALSIQRSKSDLSKQGRSSTPGLTELMTRHGGPPIPTLASPMHEREPIVPAQRIDNEDTAADDDEDEQGDEVAIKMDLEIRAEDIIPTLEGFRDHARRLNPRLEPYLIERIGQEQIRRYKKLVETKIRHTRAVQTNHKCASGKFCFELGGDAVILAPRASSKDPEATLTQFQVCSAGDNDIDESGFAEGIVTPALFPPGIPLPPVNRLPAELECPLCFKVKKFQKPSDWTKHVHEDIQPFSCTFPHCPESKSFKRKADWVRHENELHRHLEWWKCSIQECSHVCFRKDNFVQHLVREHKMKEPKVRSRGSGSSKNKAVNNTAWSVGQEDMELWYLVDSCREETKNKPRDEPCRFCGNVCSSFKKLSVHMGKHLEQIAMPVLQLVNMREVAPDTSISPIDRIATASLTYPTGPGTMQHHNMDGNSLSPYPASATSAYQTSSAGQSPASNPGRSQHGGYHFDAGLYSSNSMISVMQGPMAGSPYGAPVPLAAQSNMYMGPSEYIQPGSVRHPHEYNVSPQSATVTPQSAPVTAGYSQQFYDPTGSDYTQGPMVGMYPMVQSTQGFGAQYASPMLHDHPSHSPMAGDSVSGLGLQTMNPNYVYGAPDHGETGSNMQFSQ